MLLSSTNWRINHTNFHILKLRNGDFPNIKKKKVVTQAPSQNHFLFPSLSLSFALLLSIYLYLATSAFLFSRRLGSGSLRTQNAFTSYAFIFFIYHCMDLCKSVCMYVCMYTRARLMFFFFHFFFPSLERRFRFFLLFHFLDLLTFVE